MMEHAWEMERKLLTEGIPHALSLHEQTWDEMADEEHYQNQRVKRLWHSRVPGSGACEKLMFGAVSSMENMGYDVSTLLPLLDKGETARKENRISDLCRITTEINFCLFDLPKVPNHPYHQYRIYENYTQYCAAILVPEDTGLPYHSDVLLDKTIAAWQGQIIGGAIGTALEGYTYDNIKQVFGDIYYYTRKPNTYNDDITFELAFLFAYEKYGAALSSADIAKNWEAYIPFGWSGEDIALRNIRLGVKPPQSGFFHNPFREWIGAQMRGAICGMVAPGNIALATALAWKDGVISHHNNGVLGEVFNAALLSYAYIENDMRKIVANCVALMPEDSEYGQVCRFALHQAQHSNCWLDAWRICDKQYIAYNWVHAYPNAAAQIIALFFGNGDFEQTLHIIVMAGMDVDCNAAQILSAVAVQTGTKGIPPKFMDPIGENLDTYIRDYKQISIQALAKRTVQAAMQKQ